MKEFQIGNYKPKSNVLLAPMSEYTDRSFRKICADFGAGLVFTEMIHASWLLNNNPKTMDIARIDGGPTVYQLVGSNLGDMRDAAVVLEKRGAPIIDLNMGCPDKELKDMGAGVYLTADIDKAKGIAKAVVDAVKVPVTAKIRLGVNQEQINCKKLARALEGAGISAITLHPRAGTQRLTGPSYWVYIHELKQNLHIPVIGNGDVQTLEDAKFMLKSTKCDAVMIGRGAIGNPFIFKQIATFLSSGKVLPDQTFEERSKTIISHAEMLLKDKGHSLGMQWVRRFLPFYLENIVKPEEMTNFVRSIQGLQDLKNALEHVTLNTKPAPTDTAQDPPSGT